MAERMILPLVCLLCAFPFYMLSYLGKTSKKPIHFWNGDAEKLSAIVKDTASYNREMAAAYRRFALIPAVLAPIGVLLPWVCGIGIFLHCTAGLLLLYRTYQKILKRYS